MSLDEGERVLKVEPVCKVPLTLCWRINLPHPLSYIPEHELPRRTASLLPLLCPGNNVPLLRLSSTTSLFHSMPRS